MSVHESNNGAFQWDALFVWRPVNAAARIIISLLVFATATQAMAVECLPDHIDEYVRVAQVFDGDTVQLEDGRKLRFIGINAPELAHDKNEIPEPYAVEARDALEKLLAGHQTIGLRYDETRYDRYHRLLAHLYLDQHNVEAWLLERGYALQIVVPPNRWNVACYQAAEQQSRKQKLGLWGLPSFHPLPASELEANDRRFHIITGKVERIGKTAKSVWINLEEGVAVRIARSDLPAFEGVDLHGLKGLQIIVRGWFYPYKGHPMTRLRHPSALQIVGG